MKISGNATHDFYLYVPGFLGGCDFTGAVHNAFREFCIYGESGSEEEIYFQHAKIVSDFLHGGKMAFACQRCMIYDYLPVYGENILPNDFRLMLSYFSEERILRISFHIAYDRADQDKLIAERQSGTNRKYRYTDGKERSFAEIRDEVLRKIAVNPECYEETFLLEINNWDDYGETSVHPVSAVREDHAKLLYGFLTGDEGWEYVPEDTVNVRLEDSWSSRDFMRLYSFGPSFLLLNFNQGLCYRDYLERQREFGEKTYGGINDYFLIPSCPLSVNHGVMHACEYVLVIKSIVDRIYTYHTSLRTNKKVTNSIHMAKHCRSEILGALNKLDRVQISEIGELESVILRSQDISPVVEKVKSLLDLLESELDLAYSTHTNVMVNILTVAGLLLTVLGMILPYLF